MRSVRALFAQEEIELLEPLPEERLEQASDENSVRDPFVSIGPQRFGHRVIQVIFAWCIVAVGASLYRRCHQARDSQAKHIESIGNKKTIVEKELRLGAPIARENRTNSLGLAVCIAGQLSRLELASKIVNVLHPVSQYSNVDVFLALEVGDAIYNNKNTHISTACDGEPSHEEVERRLAPFLKASSFVAHEKFAVGLDRFPNLYTGVTSSGPDPSRDILLSNIMNMVKHVDTCAQLVEAHEKKMNGWYDSVLKLRDNTIVVNPFVYSHTDSVLSKACSSWEGINDKVLLTPRRYLAGSLGGVYPAMVKIQQGSTVDSSLEEVREAFNSETLLESVLKLNHVKVTPVSVDVLPMVDGRCHRADQHGKLWCLVADEKDCRPAGNLRTNATTCTEEGYIISSR